MNQIQEAIFAATEKNQIIPAFNIFGYEDALAVVRAAEVLNAPVILMVNRAARNALDLEHWAALLCSIAKKASIPVGIHLDHSSNPATVMRAIQSGFTSVMFDGSKLPLAENIQMTIELKNAAKEREVSLEGELGAIPYHELGETYQAMTSPEELRQYSQEAKPDWIAVSVGNIHRLIEGNATINQTLLTELAQCCDQPLVIHGASGISEEDLAFLRASRVGKINIGTALRLAFGKTLRHEIETHPDTYDRLDLYTKPIAQVEQTASEWISFLYHAKGRLKL